MVYSKNIGPKGAVYILAFMAFVFSAVGGAFLYFTIEFNKNAMPVTGWVVDVSAHYNDGSTTYKPTISYIDENGFKQTGQTNMSSSSYNYPRGAEVNILYDTRNPGEVRINTWFSLWGFPLIFLGVGIVLAIVAVVVSRNMGKRAANNIEPIGGKPTASYSYSSNEGDDKRPPTIRR